MIGMAKIGILPELDDSDEDEIHELCSRIAVSSDDTTYSWTTDVVLRLWQGRMIWQHRPLKLDDLDGASAFEHLLAAEVIDWWETWISTKGRRSKGKTTAVDCLAFG